MLSWDSRPPRPDRIRPFQVPGREDRDAVLLLHGFACSPYTMRGLGRRLSRDGRACYAPLLPGHGEPLSGFNRVRFDDWLEAAEAAYGHLSRQHRRVAVVGFSMGGTLGLHLAARHPVAALATLASPLHLGSLPTRLIPHLRHLVPSLPVAFDVADPRARHRRALGVHTALGLHAAHELLQLLDYVRPRLAEVRCPILAAQSPRDHTVPAWNARRILEGVSSRRRRLVWVPRAWHVLPVDYGHGRLEEEVARFLAEAEDGAGRD